MASEVRGRNHYKKADAAVRFSTVVLITRREQMNFYNLFMFIVVQYLLSNSKISHIAN